MHYSVQSPSTSVFSVHRPDQGPQHEIKLRQNKIDDYGLNDRSSSLNHSLESIQRLPLEHTHIRPGKNEIKLNNEASRKKNHER